MKQDAARSLRAFTAELAIYAVLVRVYFFLVLHILGAWLYRLETHHRIVYAVVAILLIAGQAVVLDAITTVLFRSCGVVGDESCFFQSPILTSIRFTWSLSAL